MHIIILILLIAAAVSFGIAALGVASRVNLLALGLFFWVVAVLIPVAQATT